MKSMRNLMLGAAMLAGTLGLGATTAQAARIGVYVGAPVAYVPPCPGAGYVWVDGYYANGYWVAGRWNFVGVRGVGPVARFDHGCGYARGPVVDRRFAPRPEHFRR
jgi:hypothetical protein